MKKEQQFYTVCKLRNILCIISIKEPEVKVKGRSHGDQTKAKPSIVYSNLAPETSGQRLLKAFELSNLSRELFMTGLQKRFPALIDNELKALFLERLDKCHNRNY